MAIVVKKVGNYREMLAFLGLYDSFAGVSDDAKVTLAKDLPRAPFVDFNGKTIDSLRQTWNDKSVSPAYTQGNIFSGTFEAAWGIYVYDSPLFVRANPPRTEDDRTPYLQSEKKRLLHFAYYDDKGVPCGFSLLCYEHDPSLWLATITHNTTASPEKRTVTAYGSQEIFFNSDKILPGAEIQADMMDTLKSDTIGKLLANLIQTNGEVNIETVNELSTRILSDQNIDNRDFKIAILNELLKHAPQDDELQNTLQQIKNESDHDLNYFAGTLFDNKINEIINVHIAQYANRKGKLDPFGLTLSAIDFNLQAEKIRTLRDNNGDQAKKMDAKAEALRLCRDKPEDVLAAYVDELTTLAVPEVAIPAKAIRPSRVTSDTPERLSEFDGSLQESLKLVDKLAKDWPKRSSVTNAANDLIGEIQKPPPERIPKADKDKFKKALDDTSRLIGNATKIWIEIDELKLIEFIDDNFFPNQQLMAKVHLFARSVAEIAYQQESFLFEMKLKLLIPEGYQFNNDQDKSISEKTYEAGEQFLNDINSISRAQIYTAEFVDLIRALHHGLSILDEPYKLKTTQDLLEFSKSIKSETVRTALQKFAHKVFETVWQAQVSVLESKLNALSEEDADLKRNGFALLTDVGDLADKKPYELKPQDFYERQQAVEVASMMLSDPSNLQNIHRLATVSKRFSLSVAKMAYQQQKGLFQKKLDQLNIKMDEEAPDNAAVIGKVVGAGHKFLDGIQAIANESPDTKLLSHLSHALNHGLSILNEQDLGQTSHQLIAFSKRMNHASIRHLSKDFSNEVFNTVWHAQINSFEGKLEKLSEGDLKTKGCDLLKRINAIAGKNPQALSRRDFSDLHNVLHYASATLSQPNNAQNINELAALSKVVSDKSSSVWKGLGAALLAYAGAVLVVIGVLGAIPSAGASLALVVAGAAALASSAGLTAAAVVDRDKGLAKSVSFFKSAIQKENSEDANNEQSNTL